MEWLIVIFVFHFIAGIAFRNNRFGHSSVISSTVILVVLGFNFTGYSRTFVLFQLKNKAIHSDGVAMAGVVAPIAIGVHVPDVTAIQMYLLLEHLLLGQGLSHSS